LYDGALPLGLGAGRLRPWLVLRGIFSYADGKICLWLCWWLVNALDEELV
jgi:hypothetical protein